MQLFPPSGRVGYVPVVLLGLAFSIACVVQSLRQGQLSAPVTYDDVTYFVDATRRLQSFYNNGFRGLIDGYISSAPHSPTATGVAFIAFMLFGVRDWAPALVNGSFVVLLLLAVRHLLRDLPGHAVMAVMAAMLAWPVMGFLVIESRPDVVNGFLVAFACVVVVEKRWIGCSRLRLVVAAMLFAAALLTKPSVFPITLALYGASLMAASLVDHFESGEHPSLSAIVLQNLQAVLITVLIVAPHYVFGLKAEINYILLTTFGAEKDLWAVKLPLYEHLTYYLWGAAGIRTMGAWFYISIGAMFVAGIAAVFQRKAFSPRLASLFFVFLVSFCFVTIPAHKSVFLGIQTTAFLFVFFVLACRSIFRSFRGFPAASIVTAAVSVSLLAASAATFQWHWHARSGVPVLEPAQILAARRALLDAVIEAARPGTSEGARVYLPQISSYLNSETLNYEVLKRGIGSFEAFDSHRSGDVAEHLAQIATATTVVVISPDDNDVVRWLPSFRSIPDVATAVRSDSGFRLVASLMPPVSGGMIEIYSRGPALVPMTFRDGFLPEEGPYPKWNLPRVRWAVGASARLMVREPSSGTAVLRLRARTPLADQIIEVMAVGSRIGECRMPIADQVVSCEIPLGVVQRADLLDLKFKHSVSEKGHTILFLDVSIVDVM